MWSFSQEGSSRAFKCPLCAAQRVFVLGHLGLAALGWLVAFRRLPLGWLLLGAILPDLVDKPLGLLAGNGYGRLYAHTLVAALGLAALAWALRRPAVTALALGVPAHLALDRLWEVPEVLLWPLLGAFPQETWTVGDYLALAQRSGYVIGFELVGAAALALTFAWWTRRNAARRARSKSEILPPPARTR